LLVDLGVQLVGIDYLSVDAFDRQDFPVHRTLLGAGVVILEGLDLRAVPPGAYELLVLPLLLQDGDGAPARAILRQPVTPAAAPRP
jgi:arylformamidase